MSTDFLALRLCCFNIGQHGRQILYFKLHVDGRKFHHRRPQVVHRCAKSYRLHNWYNCPNKPFATSHEQACFSLQKSRKSRTMLTALTFTAKSTSAAYCTSPNRDADVHGLVVRPITATSRVCFQSCVSRSLCLFTYRLGLNHQLLLVDVASLASLCCFVIKSLIGNIAFSFMFHCMNLVDCNFLIWVLVPFLVMCGFIFPRLCLVKLCFSQRKWL